MFRPPALYSHLTVNDLGFDVLPIVSVDDLTKAHHYEAFVIYPEYERAHGGHRGKTFYYACRNAGGARWFDMCAVELALARLMADPHLHLSINIAPRTAATTMFVDNVAGLLRDTPATTGRLWFEITENDNYIPDNALYRFIKLTQSVGAKVLLDDVLTGRYENIDRGLWSLCDGIKFGSKTVGDALDQGSSEADMLRRRVRNLAKNALYQDKTVTVEGIDSLDRLALLSSVYDIHFDYVQVARCATIEDLWSLRKTDSRIRKLAAQAQP